MLCVDLRAGRAAVLGATIAFGSCTLAACGEAEITPEPPSLAATAVEEEVVEDEVEEPDTLVLDAERGRLGTFDASPGFTPDPITHSGTTAGGPLDASHFDDRCAGWVGADPDYVFTADRPFAELLMMVASDEDTTLFVLGPDGEARCADDTDGEHPIVRGMFAEGRYRVWVGTHTRETTAEYVLAVSELEDSTPSAMLH